jgi:hypothetical protein
MTARDDILNHPEAFIRHNVLLYCGPLVPAPNQLQPNGTVNLKLDEETDVNMFAATRVRNRKGFAALRNKIQGRVQTKATGFFYVNYAQADDPEAFPAYICPYQPDQSLQTVLGQDATLMFTAQMSGCSFGVGIPTQNSVLVMHSNDGLTGENTPGDTTAKRNAQQTSQFNSLTGANANRKMLQPDSYRIGGGDLRATIIGVRKGHKWDFWYQNHDVQGQSSYHQMEVSKI